MKFLIKFMFPNMIFCSFYLSFCNNQVSSNKYDKGLKYFKSPFIAVEQISTMLTEKNWAELAKYYDLTGSNIERSSLISGDFFYTDEIPEVAHPAGFWKYKHPFPPNFKFQSEQALRDKKDVIEVTVGIEIDQGDGMTQKGIQKFFMRKSEKGYQILPYL